jgi:prevent-host-death family protein
MANRTITATELVRSIGDVLAKVRYRGESFVIEKNGIQVARLVPVEHPEAAKTLQDFLSAWLEGPRDPEFADLLEQIDREDQLPEDPWDTSSTPAP